MTKKIRKKSFYQNILGHNNIKTTTIYTKVSNNRIKEIKSPFDNLNNNLSSKTP
jgi:site-specific recombinase XerC